MQKVLLFTDGSVHPPSKIGFGACLVVNHSTGDHEQHFNSHPLSWFQSHVQVKRFESTSSSKLELETMLWALSELKDNNYPITAYTDSQNIISLLERRSKLEDAHYLTSKNTLIRHHQLYKDFFLSIDKLNIEFLKVKGHKTKREKSIIDQYFTLVDRASRKALRMTNK